MKEESTVNSSQNANLGTVPSCEKFLDIMQLILDDEATEEQKDFFRQRIETCSSSLNYYENEKVLWDKIRVKLGQKKCCPECVKDTILEKIKE